MDFPRIIYADISCLIKDIENKNVSYRKRIVRQDFYHKTFGQDWVHPCKIFLSSSLITKQNLVTVFHCRINSNIHNVHARYYVTRYWWV